MASLTISVVWTVVFSLRPMFPQHFRGGLAPQTIGDVQRSQAALLLRVNIHLVLQQDFDYPRISPECRHVQNRPSFGVHRHGVCLVCQQQFNNCKASALCGRVQWGLSSDVLCIDICLLVYQQPADFSVSNSGSNVKRGFTKKAVFIRRSAL